MAKTVGVNNAMADYRYEQFCLNFWDHYHRARNVLGQRRGQARFNALQVVAPDLASIVRGTVNDPFYSDQEVDGFDEMIFGLPVDR